ncbi:MAG: GUN4 domain-containing protein [Nostoc sp. DedQUE11]|nr:GUN4 domain-containing protein [Nostoc sp. DedQUE11]
MANFIGRVVNQKNEPIDGATVSLEFEGTPSVVYTDGEGIYRFETNIIAGRTINGNIRVSVNGYQNYNRFIELSNNNTRIEEIRLREKDVRRGLPLPIIVALIGAGGAILAALITAVVSYLNNDIPSKPPKTSNNTIISQTSSPTNAVAPKNSSSSNNKLKLSDNGYNLLRFSLAKKDFIKADEETSGILLRLTGNTTIGYNTPDDAAKIDCSVYQKIDNLWKDYSKSLSSESKFGFSVQRRIFLEKPSVERFGDAVGWRKNNSWITYNTLSNDIAKNLEKAPTGYLPSAFRVPSSDAKLSRGWMVWHLFPKGTVGKCLDSPE